MPVNVRRRTINLLDPIGMPSDTWSIIYNWVFNVGRYMMLTIEIIVLIVFFSRFILDKQNHDLTQDINDKTLILANQSLREEEVRYRNTQTLLSDVTKLNTSQPINSEEISLIVSSIPSSLTLDKFSFSTNKLSIVLLGTDIEVIRDYEFSLRQNTRYKDVTFTVSKSGTSKEQYDVIVAFVINSDEEEK